MPYILVSSLALFSNLYKKSPLIVGDKDADPELMRYLGARLATNYPACGSPPIYVVQSSPRAVFESLEKRGYCLMSTLNVQEHLVWVLARPRVPDDDKEEIKRVGPNDKSVQVGENGQVEEDISGRPLSSSTPKTSVDQEQI